MDRKAHLRSPAPAVSRPSGAPRRSAVEARCDPGLAFALGAGLGLTLALSLMASIRVRLDVADVPRVGRGLTVVLIIATSLSLAFMGFAGLGSSS